MIININFIKGQINLRKRTNDTNKPIGSAIKFKRKQRNLTLHEAADGICSVSYLSKLENNRIIPTDKFLEPLLARFHINKIDDDSEEFNKQIGEITYNILVSKKCNSRVLTIYEMRSDYQAKLILMGYYISHEEYDLAFNLYGEIKYYIKYLTDEELFFLLIMLSLLTFHLGDYYDAYTLISLITNNRDYVSEVLTRLIKIKCAFYMNKMAEIVVNYSDLMQKLIDMQLYSIADQLKMMYLAYFAKWKKISETKDEIAKFHLLDKIDKDYIMALAYFYHNEIEKAKHLAEKYYLSNQEFYILLLRILDKYQEKKDILRLIQGSNHIVNGARQVLIKTLMIKYQETNDALLRYFRSIIFDSKLRIDEYEILVFIREEAQNAFKKSYYYKEALLVDQKIEPIIKMLIFS